MPIQLRVGAEQAHQAFVAFAQRTERLRADAQQTANAVRLEALARPIRAWREQVNGLLAGVLGEGSHAIGLRAVLSVADREEVSFHLSELLRELVDREARSVIDRRGLDDGIQDLRRRTLELLDATTSVTRSILEAIEGLPTFRAQAPDARRVFYSWQSDLPNGTNRGLIADALGIALEELATEEATAVDPAPDRDTRGIAGSPDIAATIFSKIDAATVFVADVSIVTEAGASRPSPNPNVLVELGYALRALGPGRVVLVFNTHFGEVEDLPFDLRARRVLRYTSAPESGERAPSRRELAGQLKNAVGSCLRDSAATSVAGVRVDLARMIDVDRPDRSVLKVSVHNRSDRTVYISSVSFEWLPMDGIWSERDARGQTNTGARVDVGDSYDWFMPVDILRRFETERGERLQAVAVHDRVGGIYRSEPGLLQRVLDS